MYCLRQRVDLLVGALVRVLDQATGHETHSWVAVGHHGDRGGAALRRFSGHVRPSEL